MLHIPRELVSGLLQKNPSRIQAEGGPSSFRKNIIYNMHPPQLLEQEEEKASQLHMDFLLPHPAMGPQHLPIAHRPKHPHGPL